MRVAGPKWLVGVRPEEPAWLLKEASPWRQSCSACIVSRGLFSTVVVSSDEAAAQSLAPLSCQRRVPLLSTAQWTRCCGCCFAPQKLCPLQPEPHRPLSPDESQPKCNFKGFTHNPAPRSDASLCCQKATFHTSAELRNDNNYLRIFDHYLNPKDAQLL